MAWADARGQLAQVLGEVTITDPPLGIAAVYEWPPAKISATPAFVIYPPAVEVERDSAASRRKIYTCRCTLFYWEEDVTQVTKVLDGFREEVIDRFDRETDLSRTVALLTGPDCEEQDLLDYAGQPLGVLDCLFELRLHDSRGFA